MKIEQNCSFKTDIQNNFVFLLLFPAQKNFRLCIFLSKCIFLVGDNFSLHKARSVHISFAMNLSSSSVNLVIYSRICNCIYSDVYLLVVLHNYRFSSRMTAYSHNQISQKQISDFSFSFFKVSPLLLLTQFSRNKICEILQSQNRRKQICLQICLLDLYYFEIWKNVKQLKSSEAD